MFPSQHPIPHVVERIRRAREQIEALNAEVHKVARNSPNRIGTKVYMESESICRVVRVASIWQLPPDRWSVIVGEIIHDLRAALDNLVCALAYEYSKSPCEHTSFPIFGDANAYASARNAKRRDGTILDPIAGVHPDAQAIIKALQPYHRPDFQRDPLWILSKLSNIDKHRLFHLSAWWIGSVDRFPVVWQPADTNLDVIDSGLLHERGAVKHGTELAYLLVRLAKGQRVLEVDERLPFDIAFDESNEAVPGEHVRSVLCGLLWYVAGIVDAFIGFTPPSIQVFLSSREARDPVTGEWVPDSSD